MKTYKNANGQYITMDGDTLTAYSRASESDPVPSLAKGTWTEVTEPALPATRTRRTDSYSEKLYNSHIANGLRPEVARQLSGLK